MSKGQKKKKATGPTGNQSPVPNIPTKIAKRAVDLKIEKKKEELKRLEKLKDEKEKKLIDKEKELHETKELYENKMQKNCSDAYQKRLETLNHAIKLNESSHATLTEKNKKIDEKLFSAREDFVQLRVQKWQLEKELREKKEALADKHYSGCMCKCFD